jgi:hypothetical protein
MKYRKEESERKKAKNERKRENREGKKTERERWMERRKRGRLIPVGTLQQTFDCTQRCA